MDHRSPPDAGVLGNDVANGGEEDRRRGGGLLSVTEEGAGAHALGGIRGKVGQGVGPCQLRYWPRRWCSPGCRRRRPSPPWRLDGLDGLADGQAGVVGPLPGGLPFIGTTSLKTGGMDVKFGCTNVER